MVTPPQILYFKIPKQVLSEGQQDLKLVLNTDTATLSAGQTKLYDLKYIQERPNSTPPLIFHGPNPHSPDNQGKWTDWERQGKLSGTLTIAPSEPPTTAETTTKPPRKPTRIAPSTIRKKVQRSMGPPVTSSRRSIGRQPADELEQGTVREPQSSPVYRLHELDDSDPGRKTANLEDKRLRSRPLRFDLYGVSANMPSEETGLVVSGIQKKLKEASSLIANGNANVLATSKSSSRSSSVSTCPVSSSRSPTPVEDWGPIETIEDLQKMQQILVSTYAEYSQLRLKIDRHCQDLYGGLEQELEEALEQCRVARKAALEQQGGQDMEEGEEPTSQLSMEIDPTTAKYADQSRLYWMEDDDGGWLATETEDRVRKLLPEETRMLRAVRDVRQRCQELDHGEESRWVRRYMRLHGQIQTMEIEAMEAYIRIYGAMVEELEGRREELGDECVDEILKEFRGTEQRTLSLDDYKDDLAALSSTSEI